MVREPKSGDRTQLSAHYLASAPASGGGVVVSGEPAWLAAPAQVSPPPTPTRSDTVAQGQLASELPAFSRPTPAAIAPR